MSTVAICRRRAEFQPAYLSLFESGELERRAERALALLADCTLCPRDCHVDRLHDRFAVCKTGRYAVVSSYFPHHGEEDCLRGWNGSGTIFFGWCNLRCVFCQNFETSWEGVGQKTKPDELAAMMLRLQDLGCHNINFVTPEHVVAQILEALPLAIERGLRLPLVYNTSAYDSLESIELMNGVIDIYMPDFKFWDPERARHYSKAPNYPEAARRVIKRMHEQVGDLVVDENGLALRGLILRHLVMPGGIAGTREIMDWVARELGPNTYVNVMAQYHPAGKVGRKDYVEINRSLTSSEFEEAVAAAHAAGLYRLDPRPLVRNGLPVLA
ncbi:MAG TPA: radical SAM protein [Candidatus Xenobia bacterium]|nr:radical SAM protein [Candidatus Xenobia bacterium]